MSWGYAVTRWNDRTTQASARGKTIPDRRYSGIVTTPRRVFLGATVDGHVLFVVYTIRQKKPRGVAARDATATERR